MEPSLNTIVLENIPENPEIVHAWNDLVFRMERPEVFFTHQWALAASRAFLNSTCPLLVLVYESERLVGLAAMATHRDSPDAAFFLTASTADYCDIVSEPDARASVLAAVLAEMNKLKVRDLVLANVPAESHTLSALARQARDHGFHLHQRPAYDCGMISLGDKEQRLNVLRNVKRKKNERRGLKKLGQLGPVRLTHLQNGQTESGLESIFRTQISRFLTTNRRSPLLRPERRFFLAELGKLLSSAGWLKVSQLEVNGRPVAWNYGFRFADSWFWYLPALDVDYEEPSPGCCLLRLLTEEACADPSVKRLDLGLGIEAYKKRFSNAISSTRYVRLSASLPRHVATTGRNLMAASAMKIPAIERQLRRGRDLLVGLKSRIRTAGVMAVATDATTMARKRIVSSIVSSDEVLFFEAPQILPRENEAKGMILSPMRWEHVAQAAINNADDELTLEYLARCAQRMKQGHAAGYILHVPGSQPAHFLWVDGYNGFTLPEIDSKLESADPKAAVIFDCWTPIAQRGRGHYGNAIRLLAGYLREQQRQAWIFSAVENERAIRGILKNRFEHRFSLVRRTKLGRTTVEQLAAIPQVAQTKDLTIRRLRPQTLDSPTGNFMDSGRAS
jgi:CelD/BcsL family acetyltransferase involved in cellulose biosynthesis